MGEVVIGLVVSLPAILHMPILIPQPCSIFTVGLYFGGSCFFTFFTSSLLLQVSSTCMSAVVEWSLLHNVSGKKVRFLFSLPLPNPIKEMCVQTKKTVSAHF